jgi:FixJ family two-component response regulator
MHSRTAVDCVILDYEMPGMNGAAVVEQLAFLGAAPPVILVSGSDPPLELRAQVGAFISKPMRVAQLLECVEGVIDAEEQRHADRLLDWVGSRTFVPGVCDPT